MATGHKQLFILIGLFSSLMHASDYFDLANDTQLTQYQKPKLRSQNSVQFEQMKNAWISYDLVLSKKLTTTHYKNELLVHYNDLRKAFHMPPEKKINKEWIKAIEKVLSTIIEKPYLAYKGNKKRRNKTCVVL